jgi:hypothetical protein
MHNFFLPLFLNSHAPSSIFPVLIFHHNIHLQMADHCLRFALEQPHKHLALLQVPPNPPHFFIIPHLIQFDILLHSLNC